MKTYSRAPDVIDCIDKMLGAHHEDLKGVTVSALYVYDTESSLPVLNHGGYPALAVVRITPLRYRAHGVSDATIVVDRANWLTMAQLQREALIDHELTHLAKKGTIFDPLDRPKLSMRLHDHQFGWFDQIAKRHGGSSNEVRQVKRFLESSGQLYFDFDAAAGRGEIPAQVMDLFK